ncbi:argininosuccinate lyase [Breznakiella homolactica]|uniref:Argininosuccinate lyase n=1 Tax=Breznakiella homolactica TaxID=2798577 RepID=A0A7T7XLL7_9SPIR|nr:argininosuccinate lyase [Breznakiella homolactica]QQO08626.1 argininosuccinate lyase [Breznakiella homolactica]
MKQLPSSYAELTEMIHAQDGTRYPAKTLVTMELQPGYERAKTKMIFPMLAINEAHLIMLMEQNIVSRETGALIMKELESINYAGYTDHTYTGQFEDLFFEIEHELIERTGGLGGNLHLARSRNDMCLCLAHIVIREELLDLIRIALEVQNTLRLFAEEHRDTLYVVHTHTQHAQPSVLGHYFLGAADLLDRDISRMQRAYEQVNRSPMGAAAITTSGFPIDRQRVSDLLGFAGFIENSYDAIGNADFFTETASAVSLAALNLGRVVTDLILWATEELHVIRVADGYISTSSIMPQKRNPIALEHLRASLSAVKGLADSVNLVFFKSPYGDISDYEDAEDHISRTLELLKTNYRLFNAVMGTLEVDRELLRRRAHESFSVVTEMADEMYRSYGIPFRQAHHVVASLVKEAGARGYNLKSISRDFFAEVYENITGQAFAGDFSAIQKSMDPDHFVRSRDVAGGTSPQAIQYMIASAEKKIARRRDWIAAEENRIDQADKKRETLVSSIIK